MKVLNLEDFDADPDLCNIPFDEEMYPWDPKENKKMMMGVPFDDIDGDEDPFGILFWNDPEDQLKTWDWFVQQRRKYDEELRKRAPNFTPLESMMNSMEEFEREYRALHLNDKKVITRPMPRIEGDEETLANMQNRITWGLDYLNQRTAYEKRVRENNRDLAKARAVKYTWIVDSLWKKLKRLDPKKKSFIKKYKEIHKEITWRQQIIDCDCWMYKFEIKVIKKKYTMKEKVQRKVDEVKKQISKLYNRHRKAIRRVASVAIPVAVAGIVKLITGISLPIFPQPT